MKLTQEIVRELLDYDPETGELRWKERGAKWFKNEKRVECWNAKFKNRIAFTSIGWHGAKMGSIFKKHYYAHRIAWLWMTGKWPDQIDHINGARDDNRWRNLRDVSKKVNMRNKKLYKNNTSGSVGVSYNKRDRVWVAYCSAEAERISLGSFKTKEEAAFARNAFIEGNGHFGYHENHGRS